MVEISPRVSLSMLLAGMVTGGRIDQRTANQIEQHVIDTYEAQFGLQHAIFTWSIATFGAEQRQEGVYAHLVREVKELGESISGEIDPEELADCMMLLFDLAGYAGIDLLTETAKKLEINKKRKWGPIQEDGSILHIEE